MSDHLVDAIFCNGYYTRVPHCMLDKLTPIELILLSYLVNWYSMKGKPKNKGWFFCKMSQIMRELKMGKSSQSRIVESLKRKKYLKTKFVGWPAKRWFKINFEKLRIEIESGIEEMKAGRRMWDKEEMDRRRRRERIENNLRTGTV